MTAHIIIQDIIDEKRQARRFPDLAPHLDVIKRYKDANGTTEGLDDEITELLDWNIITARRTAHGTSYEINDKETAQQE